MNEPLIDEALNHYGLRRLPYHLLDSNSLSVYERETAMARTHIAGSTSKMGSLLPINFVFVDASSLNAAAFRYKDEYFITVNAGVLNTLLILFNRMLAEPEILSKVGDASKEIGNLPRFTEVQPDALHMLFSFSTLILPRCDVRNTYAAILTDFAFHYLIGHEIAHLVNGHVDYMMSKIGMPFLAEFTPTSGDYTENLERQMLEVDADASATYQMINRMLWQASHPTECDPKLQPFFESRDEAVFNCVFSIFSLFRLFGDNPFAGKNLLISHYPPMRLRQFNFCSVAAAYLMHADPSLSTKTAGELILPAVTPAEKSFSIITGQNPDVFPQGAIDAASQEGADHMYRLRQYWNTDLKSKLQPFAYRKLN